MVLFKSEIKIAFKISFRTRQKEIIVPKLNSFEDS